ncbi:MAG: multidrug efflux SMR transporter [Gammaproteobacteria bacterium]|nr:multidrug efflux SMR transporter [Gammaproteobacteria bacterium]MCP5199799.1 multidrug efflux SMR transporter [Gammaproteobacteria bacterium]
MPVAWILLGFAVAFEITGALGLRFSAGFTRGLPTLVALAAFGAALVIVARVMRALPVSIAYPVWAGGGTAGVALLGIAWLGEPLTLVKAAGIALVLVGVVLINRVAEKACGC